jgi:cytochrome d ubiquinol oxidase subunit II
VVVVAFLAAVYLVWEADRLGQPDMVEYFRRRSIGAAVAAGAVSLAGLFILHADSPYLFDGLTSRGLPLVVISVLCGIGALVLLVRAQHRGARLLAIGAVATILLSWGVAQWDYVLPTSLTVDQAASPSGTLSALLVATVLAVLFVVPAFALLFTLEQRGALPEEGAEDEAVPDLPAPTSAGRT